MITLAIVSIVLLDAQLALGDLAGDYVLIPSKSFNTGTAAVPAPSATTIDACAESCSSMTDCQSFVFDRNASTCSQQPIRPCQTLSTPILTANVNLSTLEIYEKRANVTMGTNGTYTPLFKDRCATYTGSVIKRDRVTIVSNASNNSLEEFGTACGMNCSTIKTPSVCKSFLYTAEYATLPNNTVTIKLTCTWFQDSIYSMPGHGFYSASGLVKCTDNRTSVYGLGVQAMSQLNCGINQTA